MKNTPGTGKSTRFFKKSYWISNTLRLRKTVSLVDYTGKETGFSQGVTHAEIKQNTDKVNKHFLNKYMSKCCHDVLLVLSRVLIQRIVSVISSLINVFKSL